MATTKINLFKDSNRDLSRDSRVEVILGISRMEDQLLRLKEILLNSREETLMMIMTTTFKRATSKTTKTSDLDTRETFNLREISKITSILDKPRLQNSYLRDKEPSSSQDLNLDRIKDRTLSKLELKISSIQIRSKETLVSLLKVRRFNLNPRRTHLNRELTKRSLRKRTSTKRTPFRVASRTYLSTEFLREFSRNLL